MSEGYTTGMPWLIFCISVDFIRILRIRVPTDLRSPEDPFEEAIIRHLLAPQFLDPLFQPQTLHSREKIHRLFFKLVHAASIRMSGDSLVRLVDLVLMAVKFRFLQARPGEALAETVVALVISLADGVKDPKLSTAIQGVAQRLEEFYGAHRGSFYFLELQHALGDFLMDVHMKVSLFIRQKIQKANGEFVLTPLDEFETNCPGTFLRATRIPNQAQKPKIYLPGENLFENLSPD